MSSTPYDDVFRTLLTDCTELMIPVVNEMFEYDTQIALENRELTPILQSYHYVIHHTPLIR